ncbi:MAG: ORF6N domain-containing protein [Deltaproteobacteria bacterium]|nr:ORF6N domain-containing protein [Deltaproteobacteria bacterium]
MALRKIEIAALIYVVREKRIMLDFNLAQLYGVETGQINRAVRRNLERFPEDFYFPLKDQEVANLKCQIGTSSSWGGRRRSRPFAFTEQGVAMLSSVLRSGEAATINVQIMRAFVAMREALSTHAELSRKLEQLEYRLGKHDDEIASLFEAIKQLMLPAPARKKGRIGF